MRYIFLILLPIFLICCENERKTKASAAGVKYADDWVANDEVGSEAKRKARVQELVRQLHQTSPEEKERVYVDLREIYVRKRDIPDLVNAIDSLEGLEVKNLLKELILFMNERWRLPNKEWTSNANICIKAYEKEFRRLGSFPVIAVPPGYPPKPDLMLDILDYPTNENSKKDIINLICTLEPEALMLPVEWKDIGFAKILNNLKKFEVGEKVVVDRVTH
jgi:hypothetical protein